MAAFTKRFTPPFCPNPDCKHHQQINGRLATSSAGGHYLAHESAGSRPCPVTVVHIAVVPSADRPFKPATGCAVPNFFTPSASACSPDRVFRQIARFLHCSPTTIMTHCRPPGAACTPDPRGPSSTRRPRTSPSCDRRFRELRLQPVLPPPPEPRGRGREPLRLRLQRSRSCGARAACVRGSETQARAPGSRPAWGARIQRRSRSRHDGGRGPEIVVPPGEQACIRSDEHRAYPRALNRLKDRSLRRTR